MHQNRSERRAKRYKNYEIEAKWFSNRKKQSLANEHSPTNAEQPGCIRAYLEGQVLEIHSHALLILLHGLGWKIDGVGLEAGIRLILRYEEKRE